MNLCFSPRWNDHNAYPRSLSEQPPKGWKFREAGLVFDETLGRPWCRFICNDSEVIHASSLVPTNMSPWLLDTDHIEYLFTQSETTDREHGRPHVRARVEETLVRSLSESHCLGILAWSEAAKRSVCEFYQRMKCSPPRICVAYPGIVPPADDGNLPTDRVRIAFAAMKPHTVKLLAIDGQTGVCGVPGRKNISDAVNCFRQLRSMGYPVELIVVGPTEPITMVEQGIYPLPYLSRAEMWEIYLRSDILMFLSRQDSFGFVLLEAMYNGVVCVATEGASVPVTSEIIQPWRTGILVKFRTTRNYPSTSEGLETEELVDSVGRLISDQVLRKQIAETARQEFGQGGRFNIDNRNSQIQAFFS